MAVICGWRWFISVSGHAVSVDWVPSGTLGACGTNSRIHVDQTQTPQPTDGPGKNWREKRAVFLWLGLDFCDTVTHRQNPLFCSFLWNYHDAVTVPVAHCFRIHHGVPISASTLQEHLSNTSKLASLQSSKKIAWPRHSIWEFLASSSPNRPSLKYCLASSLTRRQSLEALSKPQRSACLWLAEFLSKSRSFPQRRSRFCNISKAPLGMSMRSKNPSLWEASSFPTFQSYQKKSISFRSY